MRPAQRDHAQNWLWEARQRLNEADRNLNTSDDGGWEKDVDATIAALESAKRVATDQTVDEIVGGR